MRIALLMLVACGPEPAGQDPTTGPTPTCELDPDNALRVICTAASGPLDLMLVADGVPERQFHSDESEVVGWGLREQTEYAWAMAGETGVVTTGALPEQLQTAELTVTGAPFGFDAVLQALRCTDQWIVMVDGEGQIVWYEPSPIYSSPQDAYEWDPVARELLVANPANFRAIDVTGRRTLELDRDTDYEGSLHHDLSRWNGLTYLLFEEDEGDFVADGFHVFDGETLLGSFRFIEHFDLPATGNGDWTHANGINVTDGGTVILSLRNQDQVFAVDGDPDSVDFLKILWSAAGSGIPLGRPTFVAGDGWDGQHNASYADDRLYLFDNLYEDGVRSRAARYELDVGSGLAVLDQDWVLPSFCPIQSGAVPIPGGVLASCATSGETWGYFLGETQPAWTLTADCEGAGLSFGAMTRSIPIRFQ